MAGRPFKEKRNKDVPEDWSCSRCGCFQDEVNFSLMTSGKPYAKCIKCRNELQAERRRRLLIPKHERQQSFVERFNKYLEEKEDENSIT